MIENKDLVEFFYKSNYQVFMNKMRNHLYENYCKGTLGYCKKCEGLLCLDEGNTTICIDCNTEYSYPSLDTLERSNIKVNTKIWNMVKYFVDNSYRNIDTMEQCRFINNKCIELLKENMQDTLDKEVAELTNKHKNTHYHIEMKRKVNSKYVNKIKKGELFKEEFSKIILLNLIIPSIIQIEKTIKNLNSEIRELKENYQKNKEELKKTNKEFEELTNIEKINLEAFDKAVKKRIENYKYKNERCSNRLGGMYLDPYCRRCDKLEIEYNELKINNLLQVKDPHEICKIHLESMLESAENDQDSCSRNLSYWCGDHEEHNRKQDVFHKAICRVSELKEAVKFMQKNKDLVFDIEKTNEFIKAARKKEELESSINLFDSRLEDYEQRIKVEEDRLESLFSHLGTTLPKNCIVNEYTNLMIKFKKWDTRIFDYLRNFLRQQVW
jgi:hypothetical protein